MNPVSIKTKLLSVFILGFLCLNAGGAVCLVYCTTPVKQAVSETEYCPLPKSGAVHCPHASRSETPKSGVTVVESNAVSCCSLAINVLVAPIERKPVSHELTAFATEQLVVATPAFEFSSISFAQPFEHRSPVLDWRFERVKNRVFRI